MLTKDVDDLVDQAAEIFVEVGQHGMADSIRRLWAANKGVQRATVASRRRLDEKLADLREQGKDLSDPAVARAVAKMRTKCDADMAVSTKTRKRLAKLCARVIAGRS